MNDTISVIVPVYNVEKYIRESIESILAQDYEDLEIILIDDGSSDCSGMICDEYAKSDARVHVIHQKNGGAAAAKNAGLRTATGRYLAFADSDDYVEPGAYSHMMKLIKENNVQAVQCAFRDVYRTYTKDRIFKPGRKTWTVQDYLMQYPKDWTCSLLWDKLYERNLFDGIYFPEGNKIDDEFFTYRGMMKANTIITDDRIVYNYRKRASSVMLSPKSAERIVSDRIVSLSERRKAVISAFPQLRRVYDLHFIQSMIILSKNRSLTEETLKLIKSEIREFLREKKHTRLPKNLILPIWSLLLKRWKEPIRSSTGASRKTDIYFD